MPMKQTFLAKAAELLRASMRRKRWYRVCTGLAAAVVFVTTYMLILPAITLSNDQGWTVPLGVDLSVEPDYTATLTLADGSEVTIGVYDPDDHVPEGAELSAELYEEGGEQYLQAESDLWEYGDVTGYDGMMAMDIHFADAEGNEVEPTGAVYVDLRALLPENVDPDSVAVQHHVTKESEGLFGWVSGEITRLDVVADSSEETGEIEVTPPTEEVQPPVEDETQEPPVEGETQEPPTEEDVQEPPVEDGTQQPAEDAEDTESDVELPDGDTPTTDTPAGETPETKPEPSTPDVSSPDTGASSDSGTDTGASSDSGTDTGASSDSGTDTGASSDSDTDTGASSDSSTDSSASSDSSTDSSASSDSSTDSSASSDSSTDSSASSDSSTDSSASSGSGTDTGASSDSGTDTGASSDSGTDSSASSDSGTDMHATFAVESFSTFTITWNVMEIPEPELVCGMEEHTHEENCYDADGNLICTLAEHTHTEDCYAVVEELPEEELPLGDIPEEVLAGEPAFVVYVVSDDCAPITVTVYDPDGVVPAGAELKADLLAEGSDEYAKAKENLDASGEAGEYTGMAALDIRFELDGSEVEPAGQVYVDIQAQALIPADADPDSVAVQHHVETEADKIFGLIPNVFASEQTTVETVADSSAGTGDVTVTPSAIQTLSLTEDSAAAQDLEAQFAVDSFSTFTITWSDNSDNSITVYYVNTNGVQIRGTQTLPVTATLNNWIALVDYAGEISGYKYQGARVGRLDGSVAAYIRYATVSSWWGSQSGWFYNTTTTGNGFRFNDAVYLVYQKTSTGTPIDYTVDTESKGIHINLFDYNGTKNLGANMSGDSVSYIDEGVNVGHGLKFSGGQGREGNFNKWTGNRNPFSGIVSSSLGSDGYPCLNSGTTGVSDSLGYLFGAGGNESVTAHTNLNKLFIQDVDGYYVYNAAQNFATLVDSANYTNSTTATDGLDFTVYDIQSQVVNTDSAEQNVLFLPFNDLDDQVAKVNYHFGMTIDFKFIMPEDGQINGKDMVFEFEGDDDVWVFIDGKLALDLGGIHDAASGSINFNTGVITVNGVEQSQTLWDLLGVEKFSNYSEHSFNFYYMERGQGASNCYIKFNLPAIPTGSISVSKDLNATSDYQQEHRTDEYRMQLIVDGQAQANTPYVNLDGNYLGTTDGSGCFNLADGQTAIFNTIPVNTGNYCVKELGVVKADGSFITLQDANFNSVSFNGTAATVNGDGAESDTYAFNSSSTNNVVVRNTPVEGGVDQSFLRVEKSFSLPGLDMTEEEFEALVKGSSYTIQLYNGTDATGTLLRRLEAKNAAISWDNTTDTGTLVWNVYTSASGDFYMTEENYENLFQSAKYAWEASKGFGIITNVTPPTLEIVSSEIVPNCNYNFYNVGETNLIVAQLTENAGYLVYSEVPLSQGERESVVAWVDKLSSGFSGITLNNTFFYSQENNPDGFTFRDSVVQYPCTASEVTEMREENPDLDVEGNEVVANGKYLYFSYPKQWAKFAYASYTVVGGNADLSTSNTYVPATGDLSITKEVWRTDTDSPSYDGEFTFEVTVPGASGEYTATYATANTAEGAQTHSGNVSFDSGTHKATVTLYAGETVKIEDLPSGVEATIVETNYSGYSPEWKNTDDTAIGEMGSDIKTIAQATVTTNEITAGDDNIIAVTCTNTTGAVLPSTGGMGTTPFVTLGSLCTLGAGLLLLAQRRRKGGSAAA